LEAPVDGVVGREESALKKLCCLTVLSAAAALYVLPGSSLGAAATVNVSANAVTGVATRAINQSASLAPNPLVVRRGARRLSHPALAAAQATTAAPSAPASGVSTTSSSLLANFNGTSSRDSAVTNFNQEFEPPDQGLCAGNGFVMDMVNSAYTIYKTNGAVVSGPFNVNGPFDEGLIEFTSDPRCYYDPTTNTWFAIILFISGGDFGTSPSDTSHLDIAVNSPNSPAVNGQTGDPTNPWIVYQIDTTDPGGNGCPCFGDQPRIGIDSQNLYVTDDEFSILGPQFNGGEIYAFSKKDLVALNPTVHFAHFPHLSVGGTTPLAPQPALTTGNSSAEYFLGSLDPNGTFDQRLAVWALTNTGAVSSGGTPTLSSAVVNSEAYGVPPGAQQKGADSLLDSGDDRMQQTQFIKGSIWGELTTAVTIPGDSAERAGAAWFNVQPHLSGGTLDGKTKVVQQGYVAVKGRYFIYPALQVAPSGGAVMVGALSGNDLFPSATFTTLTPGSTSFGPVQIAARGSTNYDPASTRWGDYSWAVLDPSGRSAWLATEYVPPASSQTPDGLRNWGTRVMNVSVP
jgi:hypothetical protein